MHLIATYPADGQGTATGTDAGVACDSPTPDCAVPTDTPIELRFDRFLLPIPGMASQVTLYTGDPKANALGIAARYDLLERVVIVEHTARLHPNTLYTVEIALGSDPNQGFWAFDHAPLAEGPVPLRFSFTTGSGPAAPTAAPPASTDDCAAIAQGPLNVCAGCHKNPPASAPLNAADYVAAYPPMGLSLTDWGLRYTAIGHIAHEAATGNSALGTGAQSGPRFGADMALIQPSAPEKSYLMYKLLRKPDNYALDPGEACPDTFHAPVSDGACVPPDAAELDRLREWFVLGDPMPLDQGLPVSLTRDQLERVATWIRAGAACADP